MTRTTKPEQQALTVLERVTSGTSAFTGVLIYASRLQPDNRGYRQLEAVQKILKESGRLFILSNKDILVIGSDLKIEEIEKSLTKIKDLFADDPLLQHDENLSEIFFLDQDKTGLKSILENRLNKTENAPSSRQMTPDVLERVMAKLERTDTIPFLKRQSVVQLNQKERKIAFDEYYTSLVDLQKSMAPDVDLISDPRLFEYLRDVLDRRTLTALSALHLFDYPPKISLNLSVQTLSKPIFEKFIQNCPVPLVIEWNLGDIFADFHAFETARDRLHEMGHEALIDNVSHLDFEYLNWADLKTDYIKFIWSAKWMENEREKALNSFLKTTDIKPVLSRCGAEESLAFGARIGIAMFQGSLVDAMLSALVKNSCTFGQECSLAACLNCRAALSGKFREQCVHIRHLDADVSIKVG